MRSVTQMVCCKQGADQLLSAFNVATFKNQEDDKAFWNRLIPVTEQPPDADEIKQARLRMRFCRKEIRLLPCRSFVDPEGDRTRVVSLCRA